MAPRPVLALGAAALACAACSGSHAKGAPDADDDAPDDAPVSLERTPGTYRGVCDGSAAVALDLQYFLDVNDETQVVRVYRRGADAAAVRELDVSAALGLAPTDEGDLEGAARIGDRLYVIGSHSRSSTGQLRPTRHRLGAVDLSGTAPDVALAPAGSTGGLLEAMVVAASWDAPDAGVIAALDAASKLGDPSDPDLDPEKQGTNIEALGARGGELLIGFRNPLPGGRAIVVSLRNPAAAIAGAAPRFGGAAALDLAGLGIRDLAWSEAHGAVLVLAGPHDGGPPFLLYKWSGVLGEAPVLAAAITAPAGSAEAVVPYPGTKDVQILFDQGNALVDPATACKDAPAAMRRFGDAILHVD